MYLLVYRSGCGGIWKLFIKKVIKGLNLGKILIKILLKILPSPTEAWPGLGLVVCL